MGCLNGKPRMSRYRNQCRHSGSRNRRWNGCCSRFSFRMGKCHIYQTFALRWKIYFFQLCPSFKNQCQQRSGRTSWRCDRSGRKHWKFLWKSLAFSNRYHQSKSSILLFELRKMSRSGCARQSGIVPRLSHKQHG